MGHSDKRDPASPALQDAPNERNLNRRNILLGGSTLAAVSAIGGGAPTMVATAALPAHRREPARRRRADTLARPSRQ